MLFVAINIFVLTSRTCHVPFPQAGLELIILVTALQLKIFWLIQFIINSKQNIMLKGISSLLKIVLCYNLQDNIIIMNYIVRFLLHSLQEYVGPILTQVALRSANF